jgi:hypothetical protein
LNWVKIEASESAFVHTANPITAKGK